MADEIPEELRRIRISDMPKLESPFVRMNINGKYIVTPEIAEGYEWVFTDESVKAVEKLHGTNVSIIVEHGIVVSLFNRTERIPFINKGKRYIIEGILEAYEKGYIDFLGDGQHFGELIGEKVNGNPYKIKGHLWVPLRHLQDKYYYKSWGKYPKTFEAISGWFKTLMPLYALQRGQKEGYVEGIVFTHPDGRMAKLRKDMFDWFEGERHGE